VSSQLGRCKSQFIGGVQVSVDPKVISEVAFETAEEGLAKRKLASKPMAAKIG
jgi:hypothetical protein